MLLMLLRPEQLFRLVTNNYFQMKNVKRKQLAKGLKRIQAKLYCNLSETEHQIFNQTIRELKKKKNWMKPARKVLKTIVKIIMNMF